MRFGPFLPHRGIFIEAGTNVGQDELGSLISITIAVHQFNIQERGNFKSPTRVDAIRLSCLPEFQPGYVCQQKRMDNYN